MAKDIEWIKQPGELIGQYTILSPIGAGGMGQVYLCRDDSLNRKVAVKIVAKNSKVGAEVYARFFQEGRLLAKLQHPNVTAAYSFGEHEGCVYLAMEYVDGEPLLKLIDECRLNLAEIFKIIKDVATGLREAHNLGIIHRDIKPANIIIDRQGRAKLIDFGIAKALVTENEFETEVGTLIGTLNYIAPELFSGEAPTAKSDIYSLGLVLNQMLTAIVPFGAKSSLEVMEKIRTSALEIPFAMVPVLPASICATIQRATQREEANRTATLTEFIESIESVDLNHVPRTFRFPLQRVKIKNRDQVTKHLENILVPRWDWPPVLSHALSKSLEIERALISQDSDSTWLTRLEDVTVDPQTLNQACEEYRALSTRLRSAMRLKRPVEISKRRIRGGLAIAGLGLAMTVVATAVIATKTYKPVNDPNELSGSARREPAGFSVPSPPSAELLQSLAKLKMGDVVEPPGPDPWQPVPRPNPKLGLHVVFSQSLVSKQGVLVRTLVRSKLIAFDNLNWKWETHKIDPITGADLNSWTTWGRPSGGMEGLVRIKGDFEFGEAEITNAGHPEVLFPLRAGKIAVFESRGEMATDSETKRHSVHWSFNCVVLEREQIKLKIGDVDTIRVDCFHRGTGTADTFYYSPAHHITVVLKAPRTLGESGEPGQEITEIDSIVSEGTGMSYEEYLKTADTKPLVEL
ncbi:MAG: serine/threonine-protein kinase [Bdellovibrionales bacterium]|nr:serine/threonine-protein kinase [Bdellovibrionales bacterium]